MWCTKVLLWAYGMQAEYMFFAPLIILVSGISVDSLLQQCRPYDLKGRVRQSLIDSYNVCAGHYQCCDEFKTIWPCSSNLCRN